MPRIQPPNRLGSFLGLLALLLTIAPVQATPLPPGVHASRPCADGPPATHEPLDRSVDNFSQAIYDLDFGTTDGTLSRWLTLKYADGVVLHVQLSDIRDEQLDAATLAREAIDLARICDGRRVFPRRMSWSTTPRLWSAKREALRIMDDYNTGFILRQGFPIVFTLLTATLPVSGVPPATTRHPTPLPGRSRSPLPLPRTGTTPQPTAAAPAETPPLPIRPGTMRGGANYDRAHRFDYPQRELIIEQPGGGQARLDGYDPALGEIVSRKFTQLADIQEKTAFAYLRELATKYRPGYIIARVPSSGNLGGRALRGRQFLEVPVQTRPVPQNVINEANRLNIVIRDVTGRIYP